MWFLLLVTDDLDMKCKNANIGTVDLHWICATNAKKKQWLGKQNQSIGCCHTLSINCLQGKETNTSVRQFVIWVNYPFINIEAA